MTEQVDDRIECAECGRWFRSVANHVYRAHGMTVDEYRTEHRLLPSDPLVGVTTSAKLRESALRHIAEHPEEFERFREGVRSGPPGVHAPGGT